MTDGRLRRRGARKRIAAVRWGLVLMAAGVFAGTFLGLARRSGEGRDANPLAALAQEMSEGAPGDYSFFTYRRYLWVVRHSTGTAQFFVVPESQDTDKGVEASKVYRIDRKIFPVDQVRYQVSDRNLTNYLWILNPSTGQAMFVQARRNGEITESPLITPKGL